MENATDSIAGAGVLLIIAMAIAIFMIAAVWKVFTKAGQPGWAVLIPIYNVYILLKIAGKPGWWLLLMFIPLVNLVVGILAVVGLSANFGKGGGFVDRVAVTALHLLCDSWIWKRGIYSRQPLSREGSAAPTS